MKFKSLLLIALITILAACETDNSLNVSITEADLIGTWNLTEQRLENGKIVYVGLGQNITASYNSYTKDEDMRITFSSNPKILSAEGSYTIVATVNINGQTQTDEEVAEAITDPAENPNWELNGNNITLSNDTNLPANLIIDSYNGTVLTLRSEINETITDSGQSATVKATMYLILEK